jgi:hypothetical protein
MAIEFITIPAFLNLFLACPNANDFTIMEILASLFEEYWVQYYE